MKRNYAWEIHVPENHFRRDPAPHPLPQRLARGINSVIRKNQNMKHTTHETVPEVHITLPSPSYSPPYPNINSIILFRKTPLPLPCRSSSALTP